MFDLTHYGQTPSSGQISSSSPLFDLDHYSQTTDAGQTDYRLACIHFKRWFRSDRLSVDACHPVVGVRLALNREAQLLHVLRAGATSKTTIADTVDVGARLLHENSHLAHRLGIRALDGAVQEGHGQRARLIGMRELNQLADHVHRDARATPWRRKLLLKTAVHTTF